MKLRWSFRAANDRSREARQESNPAIHAKNPVRVSEWDFYFLPFHYSLFTLTYFERDFCRGNR